MPKARTRQIWLGRTKRVWPVKAMQVWPVLTKRVRIPPAPDKPVNSLNVKQTLGEQCSDIFSRVHN